MKTPDRQKLDVVNKTRSNTFGWRVRFTPEFKPLEFERFPNVVNSPHLAGGLTLISNPIEFDGIKNSCKRRFSSLKI